MADARRTRWVAHDVYFLDDTLGVEVFDRFGGAGVALWHGFIAACKKNHIEGEITYSSEAEALATFGLPGMPLVDSDGQPFDLEDFFDLLGDHKVTRRSRRARRLKVVCTRWERWQNGARRQKAAERKRRSGPQNTATMPDGNAEGVRSDTDTDTDTEEPSSDVADATPDVEWSQTVRDLTRRFAKAVKANGFKVPGKGTRANENWLRDMDRLLRLDERDPDEVAKVIDWATADNFWRANIRSVAKLRDQYPALLLRMGEDNVRPFARKTGVPRACQSCGETYTPEFFGDVPRLHDCGQGESA